MKPLFAVILILICSIVPACADESDDLIKLAQSGVDEEVLLAYIDQSSTPFDLSADDVVSLKDLGVSSRVIIEAMRHGRADTLTSAPDSTTAASTQESTATAATASASQVVAPPEKNLNMSYFYEAMNPYGIWRSVDGVWCWQPNATVIDYSWAPYCNHGHWVYTDWGWAWVSDYSWGWAAFHYGRWFHHPQHGWLWYPGTEWGPAWVSWRTSADYFGWAPLPPNARFVRHQGFYFGAKLAEGDFEFGLTATDYYFVHARHFCDPNPWEHVEPAVHVNRLYKSTVVVKNNYIVVKDRIVNQGPQVSVVAKITNKNIKPIAIQSDNIRPGQPVHAGFVRQDRLVVYKPAIAADAPETPAVVKQRMSRTAAPAAPPQTNDRRLQEFEKRQTDARALTAKKQRMAADSAERQRERLEKEAQRESDQKKRAALKADASVAAMKAQEARHHAEKAEQWKQPEETPLPKVKKTAAPPPGNTQKDLLREHKALVKNVDAEAQAEKRKKKALEDELRKEAAGAGDAKQ
jgi:hypothetical protein